MDGITYFVTYDVCGVRKKFAVYVWCMCGVCVCVLCVCCVCVSCV